MTKSGKKCPKSSETPSSVHETPNFSSLPESCSHRCTTLSFPVCFDYLHISTLIRPLTFLSSAFQPIENYTTVHCTRYTNVSNQCMVGAVALATAVYLNTEKCTIVRCIKTNGKLVLLTSQARFWKLPKMPATQLEQILSGLSFKYQLPYPIRFS